MLAGKQIVKFARNIDTLGFFVPRLIDEQNRLLCGDARGPASRTVVIAAEKPRIDPLTPSHRTPLADQAREQRSAPARERRSPSVRPL